MARTDFRQQVIFIMALIDQEDKGKKEKSKESFIINFNKQLFACFLCNCFKVTLFLRLSSILFLSKEGYDSLVNMLIGTE